MDESWKECGDQKIRFGEHSGTMIKDIPLDYLEWADKVGAGNSLEKTCIVKYLHYLNDNTKQ